MWNNRSILFHRVCLQALLRGLSAVRLAQVAHVCFSPEYWEGRKSKKVGVWGEESRGICRGEPAEYQPDISRIADQNPCSCKKIKTNNPPNWRSSKQAWEMCVFSLLLLSVVTFSVSLSFPHAACQANLTGSGLPGAIMMVPCRDVAAPRKMLLSLADLWRQSSSCGLLRSDSFASKIK